MSNLSGVAAQIRLFGPLSVTIGDRRLGPRDDEPYAEWAIRLRDHYEVRIGEAAAEAAGEAAAVSEWRAAHRFAERAIDVDSWNEPAYRLSMLAVTESPRSASGVRAPRGRPRRPWRRGRQAHDGGGAAHVERIALARWEQKWT